MLSYRAINLRNNDKFDSNDWWLTMLTPLTDDVDSIDNDMD